MGRKERSEEDGKEEQGLGLSKNGHVTKNLIDTGFCPATQAYFIFSKDGCYSPGLWPPRHTSSVLLITASTKSPQTI